MARPQKNNADYFSHDNDMRNDEKIKAVRRKFKHEGYSIWNMMLEKLSKSEGFTMEYNDMNIELWAGDFEIETEKLSEVLDYFLRLELLVHLDGEIFSETMVRRFTGLIDKRNKQRERFLLPKPDESGVSASEMPQSKVKQSKVKYSKVKKEVKPKKVFTPPSLLEFQEYFQENGFKKEVAERAWKGYSVADWYDSQGNKVKNWKQKCQNVWFKDENKQPIKFLSSHNKSISEDQLKTLFTT